MSAPDVVRAFHEARRDGRPVASPHGAADLTDALDLQLAIADRFAADGDSVGGWKTGLTSGRHRDRLGEGVRPFGFIQGSRILRSPAVIPFRSGPSLQIEPELCLVLGTSLSGADVGTDAARAAVRALAPAFEINELRVPAGLEVDPLGVIVDGLAQWGIVVGAEVPVADVESRLEVRLMHNGEHRETVIGGRDVLIDDPFLSLARLCAGLHRHGRSLEAGQMVITGSYCHVPVDGPGSWSVAFTGIGGCAVTFAAP
jgi:2-keto-4-pentenoate hydratase